MGWLGGAGVLSYPHVRAVALGGVCRIAWGGGCLLRGGGGALAWRDGWVADY